MTDLAFASLMFRITAERADIIFGGWLLAVVATQAVALHGVVVAPGVRAAASAAVLFKHVAVGHRGHALRDRSSCCSRDASSSRMSAAGLDAVLWAVIGASAISTDAGTIPGHPIALTLWARFRVQRKIISIFIEPHNNWTLVRVGRALSLLDGVEIQHKNYTPFPRQIPGAGFPENINLPPDKQHSLDEFANMQKLIQKRLNEATDNPRHFEKVQWFARYWQKSVPYGVPMSTDIIGPGMDIMTWRQGGKIDSGDFGP